MVPEHGESLTLELRIIVTMGCRRRSAGWYFRARSLKLLGSKLLGSGVVSPVRASPFGR
jgi:hypothetical protein